MNNYRVEDVGEVDYFGIITKYFEYYRDDVRLINKCIDIKNNKANKIIYAIHALSNHAIKDFYYRFHSLYSDKISYAKEKFCDDFYEDDYEIYDEYLLHDVDGNTIEISPSGAGVMTICITNPSKTIDVQLFENIVLSCCESLEEFNEYK